MRVWIDQAGCSGVGVCVDAGPDVFVMGDDGLAYIRADGRIVGDREPVELNATLLEQAMDAAED